MNEDIKPLSIHYSEYVVTQGIVLHRDRIPVMIQFVARLYPATAKELLDMYDKAKRSSERNHAMERVLNWTTNCIDRMSPVGHFFCCDAEDHTKYMFFVDEDPEDEEPEDGEPEEQILLVDPTTMDRMFE